MYAATQYCFARPISIFVSISDLSRVVWLFATIMILVVAWAPTSFAERITSFDSKIEVQKDGTIVVAESIWVEVSKVHTGRREFHRHPSRHFPAIYRDGLFGRSDVELEVISLTKNGEDFPYRLVWRAHEATLFFGDGKSLIRSGRTNYKLKYKLDGKIRFLNDFDELQWDVTGYSWPFVIERVNATVVLPEGASIRNYSAHAGSGGEEGRDFEFGRGDGRTLTFTSAKRLPPGFGFSIIVSWPTGFVDEPNYTLREVRNEIEKLVGKSPSITVNSTAVILLVFVTVFLNILVWSGQFLRKPKQQSSGDQQIDISPACARYLWINYFDHRIFASALISMAVKGFHTVLEDTDGQLCLKKTGQSPELSTDESAAAKVLYGERQDKVELSRGYMSELRGANYAVRRTIERQFKLVQRLLEYWNIFRFFCLMLIVGVVLLVDLGFVNLSGSTAPEPETGSSFSQSYASHDFLLTPFCIWGGLLYASLAFLRSKVTVPRHPGAVFPGFKTVFWVFAVLFGLFVEWRFLEAYVEIGSVVAATAALAVQSLFVIIVHVVWVRVFIANRTLAADQMDLIQRSLEVSADSSSEMHASVEDPVARFERLLPYAVALDSESEWCERFFGKLERGSTSDPAPDAPYTPTWYSGSRAKGNLVGMVSAVNSKLAESMDVVLSDSAIPHRPGI